MCVGSLFSWWIYSMCCSWMAEEEDGASLGLPIITAYSFNVWKIHKYRQKCNSRKEILLYLLLAANKSSCNVSIMCLNFFIKLNRTYMYVPIHWAEVVYKGFRFFFSRHIYKCKCNLVMHADVCYIDNNNDFESI